MVTLGMFYNANKNRVANLALPRNGTVFDYNINQGRNHDENDYYVEAGAKKVLKINGEPYIVRNENPYVLHKAHTLHFQGRGKMKMPTLFTGKNFIGQWRCRILRAREIAKNRVASLIR